MTVTESGRRRDPVSFSDARPASAGRNSRQGSDAGTGRRTRRALCAVLVLVGLGRRAASSRARNGRRGRRGPLRPRLRSHRPHHRPVDRMDRPRRVGLNPVGLGCCAQELGLPSSGRENGQSSVSGLKMAQAPNPRPAPPTPAGPSPGASGPRPGWSGTGACSKLRRRAIATSSSSPDDLVSSCGGPGVARVPECNCLI